MCHIPELNHRGEYLLSEDGVCIVAVLVYRGIFLASALTYRWAAHEKLRPQRSYTRILVFAHKKAMSFHHARPGGWLYSFSTLLAL